LELVFVNNKKVSVNLLMVTFFSVVLAQLIAEFACVARYNSSHLYPALSLTFCIYELNSLFLFHGSKTAGWH